MSESFLFCKNGEVLIDEDLMDVPVIRSLYKSDRSKEKSYFKECIAYCYWMYKKDGHYHNKLPAQAMILIRDAHLKLHDPVKMESDVRFKEFKKYYIEHQMTLSQAFYLSIRQDMQDLLDHIASIPFVKRIDYKHKLDEVAAMKTGRKYVSVNIEIDNSDEKAKAIGLSEKLIGLEEKISLKIKKETRDKVSADSKAIFDMGD